MFVLRLTVDGLPEQVFRTDSRYGIAKLAEWCRADETWDEARLFQVDDDGTERPLAFTDVELWSEPATSGQT